MQEVFQHVKIHLLRGMPTGMLVTHHNPTFNYDGWQNKTIGDNESIRRTMDSDCN